MFRAPLPWANNGQGLAEGRRTGLGKAAQGERPQTPPRRGGILFIGPSRGSSLRIWKKAILHSLIMHLGTARAGAFCKMFSV